MCNDKVSKIVLECIEATAAGYTYEMITIDKVDVVISPPCTGSFMKRF